MRTTPMRSEAAWSYLDPKPICIYDPKYDAHLVYWNGVGMTRSYALMIYSSVWMQLYFPDSAKKVAWEEFNKIYRSGAFSTRAWDHTIDSKDWSNFHNLLIKFISKKDPNFFTQLKAKYSPDQAISWFLPSKEIQVS